MEKGSGRGGKEVMEFLLSLIVIVVGIGIAGAIDDRARKRRNEK